MAWLIHPDDFDALTAKCAPAGSEPWYIVGSIEIRRDRAVESGHIVDSEHLELGMLTFAEFAKAYEKVLEEQQRRLEQTIEAMGRMVAKSCDRIAANTILRYSGFQFPEPLTKPVIPC
jgi:hypothetical protein